MEIEAEQLYSTKPLEIINSRKQAILKSLEEERQARRNCIAQGKKFKIESYEKPSSPLSLHEENRPLKYEFSSVQRSVTSKISSVPSECTYNQDARPDFMHNQLKEPDFEQLSLIYENYLRSPKMTENPEIPAKTPKKNLSPVRSSSVPNTRRRTAQDVVKEREEEFKKHCTFKPKINKLPSNRSLNYHEIQSSLSIEQRINELSRPKSDIVEKREKLRREKEKINDSECTFKPCITPYKQVNRSFSEYPVEERLYQDAETKLNERERVKREREDEYASQFPFSPQVQSSVTKLVGSKRERPPLYQRLEEVQKEISERKKSIRLETERNDPDLTFKPIINAYSSQLIMMKKSRDQTSTTSRSDSVEKKLKLAENYSIDEQCTFIPKISSYSSNINTKDFLERQKTLQENIKMKREQMIERLQSNYTFKPNIDKTSQYITDSNKERNKDNLAERLNKDGQKKMELQAHLSREHYSKYTFEPRINPISKKLGRSSSLNEMAFANTSKESKKRVAEEKAAEQERKCSFTPKINNSENFKYINSHYKQGEQISQVISEQMSLKQQRHEDLKKVHEYESMKECTFAPQNIGKKANLDAKVKVKGIERFLELREIAKRKEEEQKEREEKVFILNPSYNPDIPYTVPKPFNLHPSNKQTKIEKVKQEMDKKEQSECVFHPQTNEQ